MTAAANGKRQAARAREFGGSSDIFRIGASGNKQRMAVKTAIIGQPQAIVLRIACNNEGTFEALPEGLDIKRVGCRIRLSRCASEGVGSGRQSQQKGSS
jgi:hypothetical protein